MDCLSKYLRGLDCYSMTVGAAALRISDYLAVKDHNKGRHLRVEAYDKIGEVQRRHAQDEKNKKRNGGE